MIAVLLPITLVSLFAMSAFVLADSALRWRSAYRRLYAVSGDRIEVTLRRAACEASPRRASKLSPADIRSSGWTRAAA